MTWNSLKICSGSTNIVIHRGMAIIIDKGLLQLECSFLWALVIIFNFSKPTKMVGDALKIGGLRSTAT